MKLKHTASFVLLALMGTLPASPIQASDTAYDRAEKAATSSPFITGALEHLIQEARKIHDEDLRESCLRILARPVFKFISARAPHEAEIKKRLVEEKLLAPSEDPLQKPWFEKKSLFPENTPSLFIVSPGSVWFSHHSYPGGLVIHTWTNLLHALSLSKDWKTAQNISLNEDWLRAAVIWHDSAKTMTLSWNTDGSDDRFEEQIAGTPKHHIFVIAEAAFRGLPADFIVVLASAHNPPHPTEELEALIRYLKAGAIIAGKPYAAVGLDASGTHLLKPGPLEAFIHHMSDHDWVAMEPVNQLISEEVDSILKEKDYWERDRILARSGELQLYQILRSQGEAALKKRIESIRDSTRQ